MRHKELDMDQLQYWGLVSRYFIKTTDLTRADLELLTYLNPIEWFTIDDFKTGTLLYTWDKKRFQSLQRREWIKKIHEGRGRAGGHSKYVVGSKGKRLLKRIGRILDGRELLPEQTIKRKSYTDKVYNEAIKKFNRQ